MKLNLVLWEFAGCGYMDGLALYPLVAGNHKGWQVTVQFRDDFRPFWLLQRI